MVIATRAMKIILITPSGIIIDVYQEQAAGPDDPPAVSKSWRHRAAPRHAFITLGFAGISPRSGEIEAEEYEQRLPPLWAGRR